MTATEQEKARQARNEYARKWRAKNRDKVKANNERYWARKGEALAKQEEENEDYTTRNARCAECQ